MFIKRWQLTRGLVVFLAGILLFVGTACSQFSSDNASQSPSSRESSPYRIQDNTATHLEESYSTQPRQGGMNEHLDIDARRDLSSPAAKSDRLIEQSQRNLQRRASNPKQAVDNLQETGSVEKVGEKLEDVSENIGQSKVPNEEQEILKKTLNRLPIAFLTMLSKL
jgi:hypothetical protein